MIPDDADGRVPITIANDRGWTLAVVPFGARLHSFRVPAPDGHAELLVGPADTAVYGTTPYYLGATVGRVANRIREGRFSLDGREVRVTTNEGPHTLHGGGAGSFDVVVWDVVERTPDRLVLHHVSPAGSEGFPGRVDAAVEMALGEDTLAITMTATTDATTPVAMTNHAYWNLRGDGGTVLDHELTIPADHVLVTDDALVPTGALREVTGTPYDLRTPRPLREPISALASTPVGGFDDPFLLRDGGVVREVARLHEPRSGRTLVLSSDQVSVQLYSCNGARMPWRDGSTIGEHTAVAIEPQAVPDAVNLPQFPSPLLRPGEEYVHRMLVRVEGSWP